jgi:hypothetical protein
VCDVGAGIGNITLQLAKAHPHLQLKLQDLPERVVQAREEVWPKQCPEAIEENRIAFESIDFFTESPIPNCDVYYVRAPSFSSWVAYTDVALSPIAEKYHVRRTPFPATSHLLTVA